MSKKTNDAAASPTGTAEVKNSAVKIPMKTKIGYGFGEVGSQLSWTLVSSYLTAFYTDVVGLTPVAISMIMLIARIWDAVNDPMFGNIAENTRSRWGRFRPYILFGAPVLALFNCLTFLNLDIPSSWKAIWCGFTYIGCGMAYTAVSISVGSLPLTMTSINTERVSLNAVKGIMSGLIQMLISAVTMPMILRFGNGDTSNGTGWFMAALMFSIVSIPCFMICVFSTKEIIGGNQPKVKHENALVSMGKSFAATFKDYDARMLIIAMVFYLTAIFGRVGIMYYYYVYVLDNVGIMATYATVYSAGTFLVSFYAPPILNRIDKKKVAVASCILQSICCIIFYFMGESGNAAGTVIVGLFYGGTNLVALIAYVLGGEIIDDNWVRTGERHDAMMYSCVSFSTKLGNAIGGSIGVLVLGAVGFVANTKMSPEVLTNMNRVINFGPVIFYAGAAIFFAMIHMTNAKGRENEKIIAKMTEGKVN